MTVTKHPSEIVTCHMRTGRGGRNRRGSRPLCISVGVGVGVGEKSKLTFIHGQLA